MPPPVVAVIEERFLRRNVKQLADFGGMGGLSLFMPHLKMLPQESSVPGCLSNFSKIKSSPFSPQSTIILPRF
jgi:hypothetical protein